MNKVETANSYEQKVKHTLTHLYKMPPQDSGHEMYLGQKKLGKVGNNCTCSKESKTLNVFVFHFSVPYFFRGERLHIGTDDKKSY